MEKKLVPVEIAQLSSEELYRLPDFAPLEPLKDSIRMFGLLNPPAIEETPESGLRIVCGYRRVQAMKELEIRRSDAWLLTDQALPAERLRTALSDNAAHRTFNAAQISEVIRKLRLFRTADAEILERYFPLMHLPKNPRLLELFAPIAGLPEDWQRAAAEERLSLDLIQDAARLSSDDRRVLWELIQNLRLGRNRQREFLVLLQDAARLAETTLCGLLHSPQVEEILQAPLTAPQKTERLKQLLWEKRYPCYSRAEKRFAELIKRMQPPQGVAVQHSPFFQGEETTITLSFRSPKEFRSRLDWLESQWQAGNIRELSSLL